jgi:hypothetical protein
VIFNHRRFGFAGANTGVGFALIILNPLFIGLLDSSGGSRCKGSLEADWLCRKVQGRVQADVQSSTQVVGM